MNIEESIQQINELIEAWELNEACLNQTDIDAIKCLLKQNKELNQKYVNAVADYEKTMFEKEQLNSLVNSCQEEIRQLKNQLEENKDKINWYENFEINKTIDKLRIKHNNQQKEFISYLENEIDICDSFLDTVKSDLQEIPYGVISAGKTYITTRIKENETAHKVYKEILQKYKDIIGENK